MMTVGMEAPHSGQTAF